MKGRITGLENIAQRAITDSVGEMQRLEREKAERQMAIGFYRRLREWIDDFERPLGPDEETWIQAGGLAFRPQQIGFANPALITFRGDLPGGERFFLIQHINQINVALIATKRPRPEDPKKPIGFGAAPGDAV